MNRFFFPPPGNVLAFIFQGTLLSPISPNLAIIDLYGSDGSLYPTEVHFSVQPIPGLPLDFGFSVQLSNAKYVGYYLKIVIMNSQDVYGCFYKTFGIWKYI